MENSVATGPCVVVAADSVRARLFCAESPAAPLTEVEDLLNPDARLHDGDIVDDAGGRRGLRPTQAEASAFGGDNAKRHRAEEFAAKVCQRAGEMLRQAHADRLYLIAEPTFLGLLRKRMDTTLERRVAGSVAKSVTGEAPEQIRAVLPDRI